MGAPAASFDQAAMVHDLDRLVSIESPSYDVDALTEGATAVAELFQRVAGVTPALVDGADGPHVHVAATAAPKVLILGHHDTVFPLGTLATRPFTVTDDGEHLRATGPGVFDMKAGLVIAAHALAALPPDLRAHVEVLINSDEEVGSRTSRELIVERAQACGAVLVLEPAGDGGAIKTGRKGIGTFSVDIAGRAAHAGLEPEKGVNAILEAAHQVHRIVTFADPARGTTVTPTMASAGTAENVVPAHAHVRVDTRVSEVAEGIRIEQAMRGLSPVDPQAAITVTGAVDRPPMSTSMSAELFAVAVAVCTELGLPEPVGVAVGGASDGNFTAAAGVPTLDGLGATGGGAHADHEWVDVTSLAPRAALIAGLLRHLTTA